jgi:hypothetical protein
MLLHTQSSLAMQVLESSVGLNRTGITGLYYTLEPPTATGVNSTVGAGFVMLLQTLTRSGKIDLKVDV